VEAEQLRARAGEQHAVANRPVEWEEAEHVASQRQAGVRREAHRRVVAVERCGCGIPVVPRGGQSAGVHSRGSRAGDGVAPYHRRPAILLEPVHRRSRPRRPEDYQVSALGTAGDEPADAGDAGRRLCGEALPPLAVRVHDDQEVGHSGGA
jgi:hypothetical protein